MSEYSGKFREARVRIIASDGWLARYKGQECDATFYDPPVRPQINSDQLKPPVPRWQTANLEDLEII